MKTDINFSYLVFLSVVAALGGFLFGYDAAVISGTISQVTTQFRLDQIQTGWFVGCALVGSIIGVLFAGKLSDRYGRKITMLIAALFFSVSGIGCAFAGGFDQLVVARVLGGVGIGVVSIVSPLYISEVSIARYRGRLVSLYQLAVTLGFLGAYLANYQLLHFSQSGASLGSGWMNTILVSEVWRGMLRYSCCWHASFPKVPAGLCSSVVTTRRLVFFARYIFYLGMQLCSLARQSLWFNLKANPIGNSCCNPAS